MLQKTAATLCVLAAGLLAAPARAEAQQTLNLTFGYFAPRGEDARVDGDVLLENRSLFRFDVGDFGSATAGAEWLVPIGEFLEASGGVAISSRGVDTIYDRFTRPDGSEIEQELKLRVIPITATLRILPLGRGGAVEPYVGAGVGILSWRYTETGEFIDFSRRDLVIFRDRFIGEGTEVGPVAVFGLRVPAGRFSVGGEVRYQKAEGELSDDFLGQVIDLGGFHYQATFGIRF